MLSAAFAAAKGRDAGHFAADIADEGPGGGTDGSRYSGSLSGQQHEQQRVRQSAACCAQQAVQVLYVAPERLVNQQFIDFARQAYITMVAVDEAHCVSQWGHSFRKEYYNIPDFIQALPTKPLVAAFTATATPDVRRDIIKRLGIPEAKIVVTGFDRPNLHFAVQRTQDKERSLLEFMRKHKKDCGVVYCATRNKVESVTQLLRRQGFSALRYHAGLTPEERRENQNAFVGGSVPLIVATNAFGMGIDKPDVRFVVHYNMPKDIESYYQEAGRAGRDGLPAECLLLYDKADIAVNTYLIGHDQPDLTWKEHELQLLSKMTNYCNTSMCLRKVLLEYFGEKQRRSATIAATAT